MLKKYNIVLIFLVLPFSLELHLGYFLIIPLMIFYLLKDVKNIIYAFVPSLIVSFFFLRPYCFTLLALQAATIIFYFLLINIKKIKNSLMSGIITSFSVALNLIMQFILGERNLPIYLITSLASGAIYLYLELNLYHILLDKKENKIKYSINYLEIMIAIIATLSAGCKSIYGINLGIIYASFYSMYFGRSYKNIFSLIYGLIAMGILYLYFNLKLSLMIPLISSLYIIPSIWLTFAFNIFNTILILTNITTDIYTIFTIMATSIIFEILSSFLIVEENSTEEVFDYIYNQIQKNINNEILNFSSFLDRFTSTFRNPKEYNEQISNGIKTIVQNNCMKCNKRKECFVKYKIELYSIFKTYLFNKADSTEFKEFCPFTSGIEKTAKSLRLYNEEAITDSQNNIMIAQLSGVSNVIRKYVVDLNAQTEISYYDILKVKTKLISYGYTVTYFEIKKYFINDFNFLIGISNQQFDAIKQTLTLIVSSVLKLDSTICIDHEEASVIYVSVIPKIQIDVTYGYGALSCDGEEICGDNYLIKELNNGHFVSAISDGMGKGYRAFYESDMTLKLVEDITKLNMSSQTALEILNSFYTVQEYLEEYATLDFLEINRYTKSANFYKMGATTTYILKKSGIIEKIINKSLPFGLEDEITKVSYELSDGDLILMSSDGIFENIIDEEKLKNFILTIKDNAPQQIVYELLNYTLNNKIKTKDDMSIIALKIDAA